MSWGGPLAAQSPLPHAEPARRGRRRPRSPRVHAQHAAPGWTRARAGVANTPEQKAAVLACVDELAALGAGEEYTREPTLCGNWQLAYTTEKVPPRPCTGCHRVNRLRVGPLPCICPKYAPTLYIAPTKGRTASRAARDRTPARHHDSAPGRGGLRGVTACVRTWLTEQWRRLSMRGAGDTVHPGERGRVQGQGVRHIPGAAPPRGGASGMRLWCRPAARPG